MTDFHNVILAEHPFIVRVRTILINRYTDSSFLRPVLKRFAIILTLFLLLQSCTDLSEYEQERVKQVMSDSLLSVTESRNIEMDLIENGVRKVTVTSPYAATYNSDGQTETELKESVHVTVRDASGVIRTTVTSQSARYINGNSEFHFKSDVVVHTDDGRRLYTDYLEWSQHERTVHTPDFVVIVTESDSITGYGLNGTDDLNSYTLSEVTGEFELEQSRP